MSTRLRIDPTACTGHGQCAELLPELISLDEWGYPIVRDDEVLRDVVREARRTVAMCPTLALRLHEEGTNAGTGHAPAPTR